MVLSADGHTAIVGGYYDNSNTASAWVFARSGAAWSQQGQKLVGTGGVGTPLQGSSVGLSADGNTAIIGGYGDNTGTGAAWVFTRSGEGADWEEAAAAQAGECELALKLASAARDGGSVLFLGEQASFTIASQVARDRINAGLVPAGASGRTGVYVQPILVGCAVYMGPNSSEPHATRFAYSLVRKGPREGARALGFEVGRDVRASDVVLDRMWFGGNSAD